LQLLAGAANSLHRRRPRTDQIAHRFMRGIFGGAQYAVSVPGLPNAIRISTHPALAEEHLTTSSSGLLEIRCFRTQVVAGQMLSRMNIAYSCFAYG